MARREPATRANYVENLLLAPCQVKLSAVAAAMHELTAFRSIYIGKCVAFLHVDLACDIPASSQTIVRSFGKRGTVQDRAVAGECSAASLDQVPVSM
jgi:hypothetical protein